ncbi:MAG TPA: hypothetical protein PLD73_01090 [Candidatus Hydrogenedentes bacterium]|jgi:hypothetical protein|nr:hypothetical protein [Candidatus Hydrogenedentota bacterium]
MNLETIEQRVLSYLKQVRNPLVPFEDLLEHLQRDELLETFTEAELLAFLRAHELFEVVEPIQFGAQELQEAGLAGAEAQLMPHVILTTRVPTERQMAEQMARQLEALLESLNDAMKSAKESAQSARVQALIRLVDRANELQKRVARFV